MGTDEKCAACNKRLRAGSKTCLVCGKVLHKKCQCPEHPLLRSSTQPERTYARGADITVATQAGERESLLQTKESIIEYVTQHRPRIYHTIPQHAHESWVALLERLAANAMQASTPLEKEWWIAVFVCTPFFYLRRADPNTSLNAQFLAALNDPRSFVSTVSQTAPKGNAPAKHVRG